MQAPKSRKLEHTSTQVHSKSASKLGLYAAYHQMPKVAYMTKDSKPPSVLG